MPIRDYHYLHGAAIVQLINTREFMAITKRHGSSHSEYLLNNDTAFYIKTSEKRDQNPGKWTFLFSPAHQTEVRSMYDRFGDRAFILLVCPEDGICVLRYGDYAACLDENFGDNEWLEVVRPLGGGFRLRGAEGELNRIIPLVDFPRVMF